MRQLTKHIIWIVVVAFVGTIVFAWGMQFTGGKKKTGVIATINGQDIQLQTFQYFYAQNLEGAREQYGEVTDQTAKAIRDNTWNNLIYQTLLQQEIKRRNIKVTGKELYDFLKRFPPPELKKSEIFQTDGEFDSLKYVQALADPRIPWGQLETMIKPQLEITKLQEQIIGLVRVSDDEVKREYILENEKVKVKYIFISPDEFEAGDIEVKDQEIQEYYQSHQDDFKLEQRAQLAYVKFDKKPSDEDDQKAKTELLEIKEFLAEGEDFGDLALEYSQDPGSAEGFGDLGWFGKGEMVKPFEDVAFALNEGEVSDPVKTDFGWHLIKVLEKKKEISIDQEKGKQKVHASHILIKVVPSEETIEKIRFKAEGFAEEAKELGFEEKAEEDSLEKGLTPIFSKDSFIQPLLGVNEDAKKFANEFEVGKISDVYETEKAFFVLQLKQKLPSGIQSLEDVKEKVKALLFKEKRDDLAFLEAQKIFKEMKSKKNFEKVASQFEKKVSQTEEFSRNTYLAEVVNSPEFKGAAFALTEKDQISPPVKTDRGTYILKLLFRKETDEKAFLAVKDSLANQLFIQRQNDVFLQWYAQLKESAKIKDYRSEYWRETIY